LTQNNQSKQSSTVPFKMGVSDFSTSEPLKNAATIISCGMDFIEPGLGKIAAMSAVDFDSAVERIKHAAIRVPSANWFLPPDLKVTGPQVDDSKSRAYLELALGRAEKLGVKAVVFGSPSSRSLPDGFPTEHGREQLIQFCQLCADVICQKQWSMKIAVEHVNHTETNFINTFAEALLIVRSVDRPEIGLAADFYHFAMENESFDIMRDAASLICAVQFANPSGRCFPKPGDSIPGLETFFQRLIDINYAGGVSVEATIGSDLESDCRAAVEYMRAIFK